MSDIDMTASEIAVLTQARDICAAKTATHVSLSAAVSVLTSVLRRTGSVTDDDSPIELRGGV
jgi:hypothetical protein